MNTKKALLLLWLCLTPASAFAWEMTATFEAGTPGQRAYGSTGFNGAETGTQTLFSNARAHTGSQSALFHWTTPDSGYDECTGQMNYPATIPQGGQVWIRAYYYFNSGWSWANDANGIGGTKIMRNHNSLAGGGNALYNSIFTRGLSGYLMESSEPAAVDEEDSSGVPFDIGQWQSIELYVYNSSVIGSGIIRIWKNGVLLLEDVGEDRTLSNSTDISDWAFFMSTWNGGVSQDQDMWIDDIVITTDQPTKQDASGNYMIGPDDWGGGPHRLGSKPLLP